MTSQRRQASDVTAAVLSNDATATAQAKELTFESIATDVTARYLLTNDVSAATS